MTPLPPSIAVSALRSASRPSRRTLLGAGAVAVLVVLVVGYASCSYFLAQDRLQNAERAYGAAHDHQLGMFATYLALNEQASRIDFSTATVADLQVFQTTNNQLITEAKQAQRQIQIDDVALASVQQQLQQDQWITAISRGTLGREATRIGHMRRALADARTINGDYVQMGDVPECLRKPHDRRPDHWEEGRRF